MWHNNVKVTADDVIAQIEEKRLISKMKSYFAVMASLLLNIMKLLKLQNI